MVDIYFYELVRQNGGVYYSQFLISKTDFESDFSKRFISVLQSKPNAEIFKYSYEMAYPVVCHNTVCKWSFVEQMDTKIESMTRSRNWFLKSFNKNLKEQTSMEKRFKELGISIEDLKL